MSDFDTALERLLTDPGFAAALAADPTAALAGYQLTAEEQELLRTQMGGAGGGSTAAVETRANQSSAFGLLSPLTGMMGGFGDIGAAAGATLLILLLSVTLFSGDDDASQTPSIVAPVSTEPPGPSFETQTYVERGISVEVPDGWARTEAGVWVDYTDPEESGRRVRLLVENAGSSTQPLSFLRAAGDRLSKNRGSCDEPYQEIRLDESKIADQPSAELEYTCGEGQEQRHGIWHAVVANGKAYSFFLTTPDARFEESKPIFDEMVRTFSLTSS